MDTRCDSKNAKGRLAAAGERTNSSACSGVRVAVGAPNARFLKPMSPSSTARILERYSENADRRRPTHSLPSESVASPFPPGDAPPKKVVTGDAPRRVDPSPPK